VGIETIFLRRPACRLVTISTQLIWFPHSTKSLVELNHWANSRFTRITLRIYTANRRRTPTNAFYTKCGISILSNRYCKLLRRDRMTFVLVVTLTQLSFHKSRLFTLPQKINCFGWDPRYTKLNCGCHKLMHKTACVAISKWVPTVKLTVMSDCAFKLTFNWTLTDKICISFPGSFRQYDYGLANLYKYGSLNPPDYNLSIISSFVSLIVGRNDWLASPEVRKKTSRKCFLIYTNIRYTKLSVCLNNKN